MPAPFHPSVRRSWLVAAASLTAMMPALMTPNEASAQLIFVTNQPAPFIDISPLGNGLGIPLNIPDDGTADIVTTIGNAVFSPGIWRIGNNGGMANNPGPGAGLPPAPGVGLTLPHPLFFGGTSQGLAPGWDDEGALTGNVYWLEIPGDRLIVQWHRRNLNPGTTNTTTFQVQVAADVTLNCGNYAQFIYRDVQQQPRPNGGRIFTIGYQNGETTNLNSVTYRPRPISNQTVLSLTCRRCPADVDDGTGSGQPDGSVDITDLLYFLQRYSQGSLEADLDDGTGTGQPDGTVDIADLLFFLQRYDRGC